MSCNPSKRESGHTYLCGWMVDILTKAINASLVEPKPMEEEKGNYNTLVKVGVEA
jgi:hypothetical protein